MYIFDRYGKLLKQLSPIELGCNGTFNSNIMPKAISGLLLTIRN
ncbi:hypothetical protein [Winogradskyella sp. R77965]